MPKLPNSFKPKEHDDMKDFSLLPKDDYLCAIKKSEMKPTQSNKDGDTDNEMLAMEAHILEGKFKDRILFINLNLVNESEQAVEISNEELGTLCRACGIDEEIDDSDELHGIPFIASVYIKKGKKDRSDSNEISMYIKAGKKAAGSSSSSKGGKSSKAKKESPFKKGNKNKAPEEVTKDDILEWADENDIENGDKKAKVILKEYGFKSLKHIDDDSDDLEEILDALKDAFEDDDEPEEDEPEVKKKDDDDDDEDLDLSQLGQKELVKLAVALELGKKLKLKKWDSDDLIDKIEDCEEEDIIEAMEELELT